MTFSTSHSNVSGGIGAELPTFTSPPKPLLLRIMSLLDIPSLKHFRLSQKIIRYTSGELVTSITYKIAPGYCSPAQLAHATEHHQVDPQEVTTAIDCLANANWSDIESVKFTSMSRLIFQGSILINTFSAHALATCTVAWKRLHKLTLERSVCPQGLLILATNGDFPSLEELDLTKSDFSSDNTIACTALVTLVGKAPKLFKLKLQGCELGTDLLPLVEIELSNLEIIDLTGVRGTDEVFNRLSPENWSRLSALVLRGNSKFSATGLEALLQQEWTNLKRLDLSFTAVGTRGVECLQAAAFAGRLPSLTSLVVGGYAAISFVTSIFDSWDNITCLEVVGPQTPRLVHGSAGLNSGIDAHRFPALRTLIFWEFIFSGRNDWSILLSKTWSHLEELKLYECELSPSQFADLAVTHVSFPNLKLISIEKSRMPRGNNTNPAEWYQAIETVLHAPPPSLKTIDFRMFRYARRFERMDRNTPWEF